ncbi:hypothetical protein EKK58_11445 [Candidatus Dependentiae bacterium]|nr:MAG: hypothetical protein EKK58_11445 [Candidatus Dependentiae bacterium]
MGYQYIDNVKLISPPFTQNLPYYKNGVYQNSNVQVSLDPVDCPVFIVAESEVRQPIISGPDLKFSCIIGFFYATVQDSVNVVINSVVDGDYIQFGTEIFTFSSNPTTTNEIFTCGTTPDDQYISIDRLASAINSNTALGLRYTATVIDMRAVLGFDTIPTSADPIWAISLVAKIQGPIYNFPVYDAIDQPLGTLKASFTNMPTYLDYDGSLNRISNISNYYFLALDANKGALLEGNNYGITLEIWAVPPEEYFNVEWGRKPNFAIRANRVAAITQDWNISNRFEFDVSTYLRPFINIKLPDVNTLYSTPTLYLDESPDSDNYPILPYFCIVKEYFNGGYDKVYNLANRPEQLPLQIATNGQEVTIINTVEWTALTSELRFACRGAFPQNIVPPSNVRFWGAKSADTNGTDVATNLVFKQKWLTIAPRKKLRRRVNAPEYMFAYIQDDEFITKNRWYMVEYVLLDENGTPSVIFSPPQQINRSGLIIYDSNFYNILGVDLPTYESSGVRLLRASVSLQWSNDGVNFSPYTEGQVYDMDLVNLYDDTQGYLPSTVNTTYKKIYWLSRLGAYESFEFEAVTEINFKTQADTYNSIEKSDFNPSFGRNVPVINKLEAKTDIIYTVTSGLIDKFHMVYLQDLLNSTNVWHFNAFSIDRYKPLTPGLFEYNEIVDLESIIILESEWKTIEEDNLYTLSITYKVAFFDNNIKP